MRYFYMSLMWTETTKMSKGGQPIQQWVQVTLILLHTLLWEPWSVNTAFILERTDVNRSTASVKHTYDHVLYDEHCKPNSCCLHARHCAKPFANTTAGSLPDECYQLDCLCFTAKGAGRSAAALGAHTSVEVGFVTKTSDWFQWADGKRWIPRVSPITAYPHELYTSLWKEEKSLVLQNPHLTQCEWRGKYTKLYSQLSRPTLQITVKTFLFWRSIFYFMKYGQVNR